MTKPRVLLLLGASLATWWNYALLNADIPTDLTAGRTAPVEHAQGSLAAPVWVPPPQEDVPRLFRAQTVVPPTVSENLQEPRLIGIASAQGGASVALLQNPLDASTIRVREGQTAFGWTVLSLDEKAAVVKQGHDTRILRLGIHHPPAQ